MNQAADTLPSAGFASTLRGRVRAALIHLALSALVALACAALVFGLWYPTPFRQISGGDELFLLIVAVDVVIGPLITLAVFDLRKPRRELVRDLAVIAALQLSALVYGVHTLAQARPVVLALEGARLRVVRAIDLDADGLAKAPEGLRRLPWTGRLVVAAQSPTDPGEQMKAIELAFAGIDIGARPELWLPPERTAAALAGNMLPLERLLTSHPGREADLAAAIATTGRPASELGYLPMISRRSDWVALVDRNTGAIVGYAPFDGF
ncbi:TfpX/TfpZ family type IV pilin accessory protein [Caldimonas sp. KR1-144]|uniref:TfpX/TfpZ family type IV pilin accessory protein n=1 Tax=Caldimonas sp. KR1-144 TaxID=3400911 RepID=UPI003C09C62C